ncbi:MAG TPA: hypothetical protein P5121_05480 [Caldilineaceae bacterium]|nr:hypothetical protein [Caldilineaceae bacterium]
MPFGTVLNRGEARSSAPGGPDRVHQRDTQRGHVGRLTAEQNPELLHWRANRLLDEMMLGAIDVAASDSVPARALTSPFSARQTATFQNSSTSGARYAANERQQLVGDEQQQDRSRDPYISSERQQSLASDPLAYDRVSDEYAAAQHGEERSSMDWDTAAPANYRSVQTDIVRAQAGSVQSGDSVGGYSPTPSPHALPPVHSEQVRTGSGNVNPQTASRLSSSSQVADPHQAHRSAEYAEPASRRTTDDRGPSRTGSAPAATAPQPRNGTEQWLFAAEQRYEQLAARHQATSGGDQSTGYDFDGWSVSDAQQADDLQSRLVTPYSRDNNYEQLPSYSQGATTYPASQKHPQTTVKSGEPPTPATRKKLRSNLLPRMSALDSRAVHQEMAMLQNHIDSTLAAGHESRIRAQHLLEKASTILQGDPSRSAEVDYYLQQVRMIVKRVQETVQWSDLYKRRLRTYLLAWLALSFIFIVSRYLYTEALFSFLGRASGQNPDSLLVYNVVTITTAFFFGAFGGGVGALVNLVRYVRQGYGFFDRKYGLRGLILPLIGALCGLVLCAVFGVVYALLGIEPPTSLWFGLIPALLAMLLGASQEYFYGTVAP